MRPLSTSSLWLTFLLAGAAASCDKATAHTGGHAAGADSGHGASSAHPSAHGSHAPDPHAHAPPPGGAEAKKLPVPYIGEPGSLDVAKGFLRTMIGDNEGFAAARGASQFQGFAAAEKPRATVVACADSRVQANALTKAPENDLFTVRNLGNQFRTAEGSVLYGVEHLHTSVLLVLGHTGCSAVKAAMGPHAELDPAIKAEIDGIAAHPHKPGASEADALTEAVVANVHDQVRAAIGRFADRVREGRLVIVGAVYDFRNDLKNGFGKLTVVDVNGTSDPQAIAAFTKAIEK